MSSPAANTTSFQSVFRQWRHQRKLSQLELAMAANISQRHISWLETGRSQPSRDMVIRLSEVLEIPLRERNVMLQSAGFSSFYRERALNDAAMEPILAALKQVLQHHDPLPAVVVDRLWNVQMQNSAADLMLGLTEVAQSGDNADKPINLMELTVSPKGLRPFIKNWDEAAPALMRRLQIEVTAAGDEEMQGLYSSLAAMAEDVDPLEVSIGGVLPVLPLELDLNGLELSLFSVISTFGTPQDITTDELRIEAFYPANEATREFFANSAIQ